MNAKESPNFRLEAFSDGVFAIALTLLILDLKISPAFKINTNQDLWMALKEILPSFSAFLLSFFIILILWVNHHNSLKLITKSSPGLMFANGFFLLCIVIKPFTTSVLGDNLFTSHAVPAVVLYSGMDIIGPFSVYILCRVVTNPKNPLTSSVAARKVFLKLKDQCLFAVFLYTGLTIMAFWYPVLVAIIVALAWIFWMFIGIKIKVEE